MQKFELPTNNLEDMKLLLEDIRFNIRYSSINDEEDRLKDANVLDEIFMEVQKDQENDELKFGGGEKKKKDKDVQTVDDFLKNSIDAMWKKPSTTSSATEKKDDDDIDKKKE